MDFSTQVHLESLVVFQRGKMPGIEVTISIHMAVEGGCDVDNVAQLQALIFLLMGPFLDLSVRLLIRVRIDEKEILSEEVRVLRAFGGKFKDSDSDIWLHGGLKRQNVCLARRVARGLDLAFLDAD